MTTMLQVRPPHPHAGSFSNWRIFRVIADTDHQHQPIWKPCPYCWGAGRVYETNLTEWAYCPRCIGLREVTSL